jgi:hypothetical protein
MPISTKRTSSSVTTIEHVRGQPARRAAKPAAKAQPLPTDADAQRALAWVARGQPQAEITYDEAAPKQTEADLARFHPMAYRRVGLPASFTQEIAGIRVRFTAVSRVGVQVQWSVVRGNEVATSHKVVRVRENAKPATIVARYLELIRPFV